jgi:UDP-N-acetylglucosamine 2-epimerase (non-hydrolysing)
MARRPLVAHVVGARPNYMKVAPVYAALEQFGNVEQRLIHTGQHYDAIMKDVFFAELPLPKPHVQLDATTIEDTLAELERVFAELEPDLVVVAGDVNSTLAGAVAARKLQIPVCHIESGLRSADWAMPEERNRVITDHLSALLLTHSDDAGKNLVAEGLGARMSFVGNTMIDTLRANEDAAIELEVWREFGLEPGRYVLVTLHRPSLVDVPELLARTIAALDDLAETLPVIFPVHPRTRQNLEGSTRVLLTEPLPYRRFLSLEAKAAAVVTDSGGIQEETTVLRIPCFTLRDNTERPITIELGTNTLLGLEPERLRELPALLAKPKHGQIPPLWDGQAGGRAADAIEGLLVGETAT